MVCDQNETNWFVGHMNLQGFRHPVCTCFSVVFEILDAGLSAASAEQITKSATAVQGQTDTDRCKQESFLLTSLRLVD